MESVIRILIENTSGERKSVLEHWKLVSYVQGNILVSTSRCLFSRKHTFFCCASHVSLSSISPGPGVVSGVEGTYPYVVWNPPEEPNGVITGYRLVLSRSGTSTTTAVVTTNDQTFYVIQSSDIPWTSGEFRVTVSLQFFCMIVSELGCFDIRSTIA